jgi:hypothetical protein
LPTLFTTIASITTIEIVIVTCQWCGKEREDGEKWMLWCCDRHGYLGRRRKQFLEDELEKSKKPKPNRKCLMCGKTGLETWYCDRCRIIKTNLCASHTEEALGVTNNYEEVWAEFKRYSN